MPETRARKAVSRPRAASSKGAVTQIIVRRGALRRFDALKRKTEDLPVVVSWDRRQADRRASPAGVAEDRRRSDRRQNPPFTWELAEFVVLATPPPVAPAEGTRTRGARPIRARRR